MIVQTEWEMITELSLALASEIWIKIFLLKNAIKIEWNFLLEIK